MGAPADPTDDDILFVKQLGVEYVNLGAPRELATAEGFIKMRQRYEGAGLKVWNIGNASVHCMEAVVLNLPGRDEKIEEYKQYLRNLAKAGIYYTTYGHVGNGLWRSGQGSTRGAPTSEFDMASPNLRGNWNGKIFTLPLSHGREYTPKEIWDNYIYFIRQVVPLAEELGIRIGIHPEDPPQPPVLAGVPRCIFGNFDGFKRAFEIADSPNVGMCLCVGCWLEGGPGMGKDVLETIKYFGDQKKIFKIHFRNVSAPVPHFVETFMDNGYMDMYKVMKALRQVNFDGVIIPDHIPAMVGGGRVGNAYSVAYMRALLERANQEVKA